MFRFNDSLRSVPIDKEKFNLKIKGLYEEIKTDDISERVSKMGDLGCFLRIAGDLTTSEKYLKECLDLVLKYQLGEAKEVRAKILMGHLLQFKKEFDKSNKLFTEIIKRCRVKDELSHFLPFAYQHSAKNQFDQDNLTESLKLFEMALELRIKDKVPKDQLDSTRFSIKRVKELL